MLLHFHLQFSRHMSVKTLVYIFMTATLLHLATMTLQSLQKEVCRAGTSWEPAF